MSTSALIDKINHLPSAMNKDVDDYLNYLAIQPTTSESSFKLKAITEFIEEKDINIYTGDDLDILNKKPKLKREFGGLKGFVKYMADDFDAPLDDFKDYS